MKYRLSFENPQNHLIKIEIELPPSASGTELRLSKWRPGRYELAPYSQNIVDAEARTASGKALAVTKSEFNKWNVEASSEPAVFTYKYWAVTPDAGGSVFDENSVYINGVNLFMYAQDTISESCEVALEIPDDYIIACGLKRRGKTLFASDFHQLVDAPLFASPDLKHHSFYVSGVMHHLWFLGEVKPDLVRMEIDFRKYGEAQVKMFGGFPVNEYHYMFIIHNKRFYHGVEHFNSTVIALGPGYQFNEELYEDVLGVSCHELFHTWNVKAIRPADMRPYNYESENYSRLHYITEGVTTYYGDLMLLKGGVWNLDTYLLTFNNSVLKRHYANNGRDHISLEHSSFDSWLVQYKPGVPNRKISFYTKGALAAFILDTLIRKNSGNKNSLDSVMREMFERFGKTEKGYTKEDYRSIAEAQAGTSLSAFFSNYIEGVVPMEPALMEAANYLGLELVPRVIASKAEADLGVVVIEENGKCMISQVHEGSPAEQAGLAFGDEVVAINGYRATPDSIDRWLIHFSASSSVTIDIFRNEKLRKFDLKKISGHKTTLYMLTEMDSPTAEQLKNREIWMQVN